MLPEPVVGCLAEPYGGTRVQEGKGILDCGVKCLDMTVVKQLCRWSIILVVLLCATVAQGDWPQFRGPSGNGLVTSPAGGELIGLPLHWSEAGVDSFSICCLAFSTL